MSSQSDDKGNQKTMAATGEDDKTKVKDDDSKKDEKFGQKATTNAGIEIPVKDDDDKDAAKASGRTSGKAGKDDAAKNLGKADGEAGKDAHGDDKDKDDDAFVSPVDPSKEKWEARVQAQKEEDRRRKVGEAPALADGKAVGKAKAGEAEVHATRMPSRRNKNAQILISPGE